MTRKIQNEDIKSEAELITGGGTKAQLPNDDKIYVTANSLNKTLKAAIQDGDIGGGGGSPSMFAILDAEGGQALTGWTFPASTLTLETGLPLSGDQSYKFSPTVAAQEAVFTIVLDPRQIEKGEFSCELIHSANENGMKIEIRDQAGNVLGSPIDVDKDESSIRILRNFNSSVTELDFVMICDSYIVSMFIDFDDVVFSDQPFKEIQTVYTNSVGLEGNDGRQVTANTEDIPWNGTGVGWTGGADGQPSYYTVQRNDSIITLNGTRYITLDNDDTLNLYVNGISVSRTLSSPIPTGRSQITKFQYDSYKGEFQAGDKLSIRGPLTRTLNTLNGAVIHWLNINETATGENVVVDGDGDVWESYAPVITGAGAPTGIDFKYRRDGPDLLVDFFFICGTSTAVAPKFSIPFLPENNTDLRLAGIAHVAAASSTGYVNTCPMYIQSGGVAEIVFQKSADAVLSAETNAPSMMNNGNKISGQLRIPIKGWSATQAHIIPIADPYENKYLARIDGGGNVISSTPNLIQSVVNLGVGHWRVTYTAGLFSKEPTVQVTGDRGAIPSFNAASVETDNESASSVDIRQGYVDGNGQVVANSFTFYIDVARDEGDYKEPTSIFIGQVATDRVSEKKRLSGNFGTNNTVIPALTFNNLVVGKTYTLEYQLGLRVNVATIFSDGTVYVDIDNGPLALDGPYLRVSATNDPDTWQKQGASQTFIAEGTSITFTCRSGSAQDEVTDGSWAQLTEANTKRIVSGVF